MADFGPPITAIRLHEGKSGETEEEAVLQEERAERSLNVDVLMAGLEEEGGDDRTSLYQLKWVEWRGRFAPIITQNDNGPCPLLALCNVLILSGQMNIAPGTVMATSHQLLHNLGTCMIEAMPRGLSVGEEANYEQNMQDAMAIFPKLQTGLDVNVKFDSVSGFEFTSESGIFDLLGVSLFHGWLADPQDIETYSVVSRHGYNQLVEMVIRDRQSEDLEKVERALQGEQFLQRAASQLTYHGIFELNTALADGELAVFFRNNHFSTIYKHRGKLLLLVTDFGFLDECGYVWETLDNIEGDGEFLDATFHLSSHSEQQRSKVKATTRTKVEGEWEGEGEGTETTPSPPVTGTDLDFHIALSLQREESSAPRDGPAGATPPNQPSPSPVHHTISDAELAMQLQKSELNPSHPPPSRLSPSHPPPAHPSPSHVHSSPPVTREDYEQAAASYHQQTQRKEVCLIL